MVARKSYLVVLGAAVLAAIVVTAFTVIRPHLFRSSQSSQNQSDQPAQPIPADDDLDRAGARKDPPDGQPEGDSRAVTDGTDGESHSSMRQVSDFDEDSGEIKAALPAFHRTNDSYCRGAVPARGGVPLLKRLGVMTIVDLRSYYDHADEVGVEVESLAMP